MGLQRVVLHEVRRRGSGASRSAAAVFAVGAASLLAFPSPADGQHPGFEDRWAEVGELWRTRIADEGVVGSSLAFMADGEVLAFETHGMADEASGRAVTEETIYHWASITKTFTGIAVLQLRDRGLLRLDDRIVDYVPELTQVHDPKGYLERITVRHLLSHSAGFRASTFPWGGQEDWHPHEPTSWSQIVAMLPYTTLQFAPGERFSYSNPGIVFLGQVIERVTGDDWEVYVDKNILKPLGMTRSYFDVTPYHLLAHRSNNYVVSRGVRDAQGLDFDTGITVSNGGLNAPVPDMARYLAFLTGSVEPGSDQASVLERSSLEEMWELQVPFAEGGGGLGLTYFLLDHEGRRYVGHTGGQKAFISFFYLDPATGAAAIAAFNTLGTDEDPRPDTRQILADVRTALFDRVFPLFQEP